jgi:hypothetical protein
MQRQVSGRALGIAAALVAILMTIAVVATVSGGRGPDGSPNGGGGQRALLSEATSRLG